MADIDEQTLRDFMKSMNELSGSMGKLGQTFESGSKSFSDYKKARRDNEKDTSRRNKSASDLKAYDPDSFNNRLTGTFKNLEQNIKLMSGSTEAVSGAFKGLAEKLGKGAIGGVLVGGLTDYFSSIHKTYQSLVEVGQDFGGNMMNMAQAAAESGTSLTEYARLMKSQSAAAAQMGKQGGGLAMLAKSVRETSMQFGLFGYSLESLNDLTGDVSETMRRSSVLGDMTLDQDKKLAVSISTLAGTTTELSAAFGKSRSDITKQAQEIMRSTLFASRQAQVGADAAIKNIDSVGTAITTFSAQLGPAGNLLGQMIADIHGMGSSSVAFQTDSAQVFQQAGMGQITGQIAQFYDSVKDMNAEQSRRATLEFQNQLKDQLSDPRTLSFLRNQALFGHNQAAKQVLEMILNMKKIDVATIERQAKMAAAQDDFTKQMNMFSTVWGDFTGKVRMMFYKIITPLLPVIRDAMKTFASILESPEVANALSALGDAIGDTVTAIVKWFQGMSGNGGLTSWINAITKSIRDWLGGINDATKDNKSFGTIMTKIFVEPLVQIMAGLGKVIVDATVTGIKSAWADFHISDLWKAWGSGGEKKADGTPEDEMGTSKRWIIRMIEGYLGYKTLKLILGGALRGLGGRLGGLLGGLGGGVVGSVLGKVGGMTGTGVMNVTAGVVNVNGGNSPGGLPGGGNGPGGPGNPNSPLKNSLLSRLLPASLGLVSLVANAPTDPRETEQNKEHLEDMSEKLFRSIMPESLFNRMFSDRRYASSTTDQKPDMVGTGDVSKSGAAGSILRRRDEQRRQMTERMEQVQAWANRMGIPFDPKNPDATMEADVPTSINGMTVPSELYSDQQKKQIDLVRQAQGINKPKLLTDTPSPFGPNLPPGITVDQLAAKVTDQVVTQVPGIAKPRDDLRLIELNEQIKAKQDDLERQSTYDPTGGNVNIALIQEMQALQKLIREQTEILVRQNKEQTDVLKQSRNKLDNLGG